MSNYYSVHWLNEGHRRYTVDDLKGIFPDGKADEMNFVMLSTSGIHGSYCSISDRLTESEADDDMMITILIIQPRIVRMRYGNLHFTRDDEPYLRGLVESSIAAMAESQKENRIKKGEVTA